MGDRCYMEITVHRDDLARLTDILDGRPENPDDFDADVDGVIVLTFEEANYGLQQDREIAASEKIPFHGWHGNGGDYGGFEFASFAGEMREHPIDHEGYLAVRVSEKDVMSKDVDRQLAVLAEVKDYIKHRQKAAKAVRRKS